MAQMPTELHGTRGAQYCLVVQRVNIIDMGLRHSPNAVFSENFCCVLTIRLPDLKLHRDRATRV